MFDFLQTNQALLLEAAIFLSVFVLVVALMLGSSETANDTRLKKRINRVSGGNGRAAPGTDAIDAELRRRQIRSAMKDGNKAKATFQTQLKQAGLDWSKRKFVLVCMVTALGLFAALAMGMQVNPVIAAAASAVLGLSLPYFYVVRATKVRLKRFSDEFPAALDIIVRGVSAGLPLNECLKTIANETKEPVRSEFQMLLNDQSVGMPLDKAAHRLAVRVPLPETSFFAIVLAVQSRSGGSLSEILNNLSLVVRGRKMLDAQIKTMSSEAKMSGQMIGAMPMLVAAALFYLSPEYINVLLGTRMGQLILAGCALWMFTGIMVMKKMINFDV
ncbi:type II secretion system F family protein [Thalassobius sp. Cn5-15]|uniref:type II secretion system F family protein n=1 Tax=Thalassobius sp. Cn5-15 TaxID=2917763 RepID=UPI001EF29B6C|nr:type II secretion system F family protein [Thalassobius sp. Cn5-15]MCG7492567.1 type II secretion system F family protein [Thalassobius sp. Cn5-15]